MLISMQKRALFLFAMVLAFSAAAVAQCHATLEETKKAVPWSASAGEISWKADKPDCKPDKSVLWVTVSVTPPNSTGAGGLLHYSVDTNFSTAARTANIRMGDSTVEISQSGGPKPGMAISPGQIEIQFAPGQNAAKEITRPLFVRSDEPLAFDAKLMEPVDWVKVVASNPGPQRQQTFMVTVKTDQFKPGNSYQANIQLEAPGASNTKEIIPVIVKVDAAK